MVASISNHACGRIAGFTRASNGATVQSIPYRGIASISKHPTVQALCPKSFLRVSWLSLSSFGGGAAPTFRSTFGVSFNRFAITVCIIIGFWSTIHMPYRRYVSLNFGSCPSLLKHLLICQCLKVSAMSSCKTDLLTLPPHTTLQLRCWF